MLLILGKCGLNAKTDTLKKNLPFHNFLRSYQIKIIKSTKILLLVKFAHYLILFRGEHLIFPRGHMTNGIVMVAEPIG